MKLITNNPIYFWERNVYGAIVIYGKAGIRQYYYYTVAEAKKRYMEECKKCLAIYEVR